MTKRVLTGAAFALLVLAGVLLKGWVMFTLISLAMVVSTFEMYRAIRATAIEPVRWAGYLFCAACILAQGAGLYLSRDLHLSMYALLLSVMAAIICLVMRGKVAVDSLMATLLPMLYPGIFYLTLMDLLRLENRAVITVALVLAFFCASINDVFALFTGMLLGKHKLSPILSPKKTVEGGVGGLLGGVLGMMLLHAVGSRILGSSFLSWGQILALGLLGSVIDQIGDLSFPVIKREFGVKDYGKLLPGHGGVLDRFDSVTFVAPFAYLLSALLG